MDNNLKSVPQRKLLRDDQKVPLQFLLNRSEECGGGDGGMWGEMKEKHPREWEWNTKALRHLLVQFKESVVVVIGRLLNKLHISPAYHK